jgi:hypothetical protein
MVMSESYQLVEHENYWILPLEGKRVSRFLIDRELKLEFLEPEDEETTIIIGGEFQLEIDGRVHVLNAEQPTGLCPIFALYGATVQSALAFKDGKLEVKFWEGAKIKAMPHPDFESWQVTGVRWLRVVCGPGGDLAIWKPDPA